VAADMGAASASEDVVCSPQKTYSLFNRRVLTIILAEDDDFDQGGYGHRNQRPRQEAPPGTRIKKGLLEIAEDPLRLPNEVAQNIAKLAAENYEDEYVRDTFCVVALQLAVEQPFKIPFVAAVVLYANRDNGDVAKDLLERAGKQAEELLEAGHWREFKLVLRLLACLSPLYEEDGILPVLDELFNRAVDLQTESQEDTVGIELVKIILLTIPYLLSASDDVTLRQKVAELLEKTNVVASTPHALEPLVDPYGTVEDPEERPMLCGSVLSLLQNQLQEEANNDWQLKFIPRVYDPNQKAPATNGDTEPKAEEDEVETNGNGETKPAPKHAFPTVTVPSRVNAGSKPLFPELFFSLYADQEIESVPGTSNIASSLIRDAILDTVNALDFNRNIVARMLNDIDCFWTPNTFVKRSTAFDKLRELQAAGKPTWKPEDVVIDSVFSQIFQLPVPEHRLVYYHSIITESCKISPGAIAPALGRAIRFLFRNVDAMDMELFYRFMDWFAHHLSNFEFRWKWTEWYALSCERFKHVYEMLTRLQDT
jgi:nuclear cap-binding protein subunit 1